MRSDRELLTLIKADNQTGLEELYKKYYSQLCDFAFQYVGSVDLSEEVVSDVFLKVWQRRHKLSLDPNFKKYLYTATRNQALNYIEKEKSDNESLDDNAEGLVSKKYQPDENFIYKELENRLEFLISTLPPRRKLIFKLSRLEGFSYKEIADVMSISVRTVQNQMVEAIKKIASCIK
ncbi:RNA polymerase sigma-70 factor [Aliifodinibius sp. S!AR15-10]|uniref:RNA polymerase sigma factor n=1 Tax=Aliifodinibius sp. S!AR15-10 TaxID=2950437 RepID=UPI00285F9589|nr:RNA polymerase sigma-70 factor [Aliifodinibius sp. S!AR15-10]MDR8389697.1 RNA polymerase sigma-70 factor [Aliifodinibius sp. S!AR15-10]